MWKKLVTAIRSPPVLLLSLVAALSVVLIRYEIPPSVKYILGSIMGAAISGLVGYFLYWAERRDRLREQHLKELKEKCLFPIRDELEQLVEHLFTLHEASEEPVISSRYRDCLRKPVKCWDEFSFEKSVKERVLYADLHHHFADLTKRY